MDASIIDRIRVSGRRLGVTKTEIAQELIRLATINDTTGLQALFTAYNQWELKQSLTEDPGAQHDRCLDNFYVAAQLGDSIKIANGDAARGFALYEQNPDLVGNTTQFVSQALSYSPAAEN